MGERSEIDQEHGAAAAQARATNDPARRLHVSRSIAHEDVLGSADFIHGPTLTADTRDLDRVRAGLRRPRGEKFPGRKKSLRESDPFDGRDVGGRDRHPFAPDSQRNHGKPRQAQRHADAKNRAFAFFRGDFHLSREADDGGLDDIETDATSREVGIRRTRGKTGSE